MSAAPGKFCVYMTAALMIAGGADAEPSACKQASFLFAKLAAASTNCNLQASKSLARYADVAKHFCGPGPASKWPGSRAGAIVFYTEVKELGREAVCERISKEMENSAKTTPTECGVLRERIFAALTPNSRSTNALIRKAPIVRPQGRYVRGRLALHRNKADRLVKTPKQES
jgi:hypothetical protein